MFTHALALAAGVLLASPLASLLTSNGTPRPLSPRPQLNESLLAVDQTGYESLACSADSYGARVLSTEPLVIYLDGFLSAEERTHLLEISEELFEPATITDDAATTSLNSSIRNSHVALIPRTAVVRCIERRALALQSWRRDVFVERLRTQRYETGGHYDHHYDWSGNVGGWGRVSSMMVWVDDGAGTRKIKQDTASEEALEGGGTEFPLLNVRGRQDVKELCRIIECNGTQANAIEQASSHTGTTFKPTVGNAIYWENFAGSGRGYPETWHSGLPVRKGVKVGLNIWSFGRIE